MDWSGERERGRDDMTDSSGPRRDAEELTSVEWQAAVDAVADGIWILDDERRVVHSNGVFERLMGIPVEQVVGRPCRDTPVCRLAGWANDRCLLDRMYAAGAPVTHELVLEEKLFLAVTACPIHDPHGDITGAVYVIRDLTARRRAELQASELQGRQVAMESRIAHLADHDTLTSLPRRELFASRLTQAIERAAASGRAVGVVIADIDRFRSINEALGSETGDETLRVVAAALSNVVRGRDTLARLGNDEFGVVLADMSKPEDAAHVAEEIARVFADPLVVAGHDLMLSACGGVAVYPTDGGDGQQVLRRASVALSKAKSAGACVWRFYAPEMDARAGESVALAPRLRRAVERNEFQAHFQPYYDIPSSRLVGMEALLRWKSPEHGMVMPDRFIPVLEETGLILQAGDQVIGQVCRQLAAWRTAGRQVVPVAVNLSAAQFRDERLPGVIERMTGETGIEPGLLVFEITESTFMRDLGLTRRVLETLKGMGATIAIDDFGTGYSSLSYLKKFPVDYLKIDRAFVREIETDPDDAALVAAMISMAHSLNIKTIAEGVETIAQLRLLRILRCDVAQGYYFARPLPPEEEDKLFAVFDPAAQKGP